MTKLDQEELLNALKNQMDSLRSTTVTAIGSAVIFWWAGLTDKNPIEIFSLSISKSIAAIFAFMFFIYIWYSIYLKLYRIRKILLLVNNASYLKALSIITCYPSATNPYYEFNINFNNKKSVRGATQLMVLLWLFIPSVVSLIPRDFFNDWGLLIRFLPIITLISMNGITKMLNKTYDDILDRTVQIDRELFEEYQKTKQVNKTSYFILYLFSFLIIIGTYYAYDIME